MSAECLFCRILAGEIRADVVAETALSLAFRDVAPAAPTHVLVIPRRHVESIVALASADPGELADVVALAGHVAVVENLPGGYRLVANTGAEAGQSVFHAHLHVLGGRAMAWPPG